MTEKTFEERLTQLITQSVQRHKDKAWEHARQDIADLVKNVNTVLGGLTGGRLFVKFVKAGTIENYDDIHLDLWDQHSSTRLGQLDRMLIEQKSGFYPVILVMPDGGQLPLGDKEALEARFFGLFAHSRSALVEKVRQAMEGKFE